MKADIIVIGGGASGLVAAVSAARQGARVLVLERMQRIGKKLLATGNGRCNYTNEAMGAKYYHSRTPELAAGFIKDFDDHRTIDFFKGLGILPKSNDGYIYPNSMQAASVLDALRFELERLGVSCFEDTEVTRISSRGKGFQIHCSDRVFYCRKLILACGGKASEKLGSNGSGYRLAESMGHSIVPVVPALTGLKAKENIYKSLSGIRAEGRVTLYIDGYPADTHRGELQLASYGISGIPVFQLSGQAAYGVAEGRDVSCSLDFFPDMTETELTLLLKDRERQFKGRPAAVFETGLLNRKLMQACMKLAGQKKTSLPDMERLAYTMKHFPASIDGSRGYEFAQVCAGGVDLNEVFPGCCESVFHPGLYITGELLDADGICGGYNLQWAWATGYAAGTHAGKDYHDTNQSN